MYILIYTYIDILYIYIYMVYTHTELILTENSQPIVQTEVLFENGSCNAILLSIH